MIEAMKNALELAKKLDRDLSVETWELAKVMGQLEQAIAEAEQDKPVAVVTGVYGGRFIVEPTNSAMVLPVNMALYAQPQPKQEQGEPDDEVLGFNGWGFPIEHPPKPTPANKEQIREALVFNLPLYTTPQPRKPLTIEQIDEIADTVANMPLVGIVNDFRTRFARAIEAAHGIKENT